MLPYITDFFCNFFYPFYLKKYLKVSKLNHTVKKSYKYFLKSPCRRPYLYVGKTLQMFGYCSVTFLLSSIFLYLHKGHRLIQKQHKTWGMFCSSF